MTNPDPLPPLDDDFIDRIVDGDLTPAELRSALDRLDREPDGWKRCGLAFLEAQCWRESFRALDQPRPMAAATESPTPPQATGRARRRSPEWMRAAIAAGIAAVSFATGWLVHPARPSSPVREETTPTAPLIAARPDTPKPPDAAPAIAEVSESLGEFLRQPDRGRADPSSIAGAVEVARLRFGGNGAEVPILAGPAINEQWLRDQPPRLDEYQQALLARQGYQVDQHRRLITATLADGRSVTLPIDEVQVRYTGTDPL